MSLSSSIESTVQIGTHAELTTNKMFLNLPSIGTNYFLMVRPVWLPAIKELNKKFV